MFTKTGDVLDSALTLKLFRSFCRCSKQHRRNWTSYFDQRSAKMYLVEQIEIDFLETLKAGVNNESMAEQHTQ